MRSARVAPGRRRIRLARGEKGKSGLGWIQGGVRWKTCRRETRSAIRGTNWTADAPVPMTATRFPVRSTEWSHSAEWKDGPPKVSRPGIAGSDGTCSAPVAETTALVVKVPPPATSTRQ
ncbi:hypothetical protein GCM10018952_66020 [Streptosporangium vulgare]